MIYSTTLKKELEKWWKHLDKPFSLMESDNDIMIGSVNFRPWGINIGIMQKLNAQQHILELSKVPTRWKTQKEKYYILYWMCM